MVVQLPALKDWLAATLSQHPPHVWLLSGPVGAGKTTLVQHLAIQFGVSTAVTSPTFALQKIHPLEGQPWRRLVHIDAYRITGQHEVAALELDQFIADPKSLVVVEWPELLPTVSWGPHLKITLAQTGQSDARQITIER